jgi:hypothetical protein
MMKLRQGEPVPHKLKSQFKQDLEIAEKWRKEAEEDFAFFNGQHWTDEEEKQLKAQSRPVVTFNRVPPVIDAVCGAQISNRQDISYFPREQGDAQANELLTEAGKWFTDTADTDSAESEAFCHTTIAGMGWTETFIDFDAEQDGKPADECVDPFEMVWDRDAKKKNLKDGRRVCRVRTIPMEEAEEMFPDYECSDLIASWALPSGDTGDTTLIKEPRDRRSENAEGMGDRKEATIVQMQWFENEPYYVIADPMTGEQSEITIEQYTKLSKRFKQLGLSFEAVRLKRKIVKQAFLGNVVLEVGDAPCPYKFSFQCITGKRDHKNKTWYGLVRPMKDPQRWANKWLAQMMHILNSSAKGGVMIEDSAIGDDTADFEQSWARSDAVTILADGALSGGKIQPKPMAQFPAQLQSMTEYAISSIRDVTGVNLELMGLRDSQQAGVLEAHRKQAGMSMLQWLFDALRAYHQAKGRIILHYLQNDLSDGRLIRVTGEKRQQYVPLVKQAAVDYDIIVEDAPTSVNQKEMVWAMVERILPTFKDIMTPEMMIKTLEYSPFPASIVEELTNMLQAPNPQAQQQAAMAAQKMAAELGKDQASAMKDQASAAKYQAEAQATQLETQIKARFPQMAL